MTSSRRASRKRRYARLHKKALAYRREFFSERGIPCSLCGHDIGRSHWPRLVRNYPSRLEGLRSCKECHLWCECPNGGGWIGTGSSPAIAERFRNTKSDVFA